MSAAGADAPAAPAPAEVDAAIHDTFVAACHAELKALKPGNVHIHAPGHRMTVADFERSAAAAAPFLARRGAPVGRRVREGVEATFAAVGTNTNLGILLLAAPVAAAFERWRDAGRTGPFRDALAAVLDGLDATDAADVFAAIRTANPGGLGAAPRHDVNAAPEGSLLDAMRAAADRDTIAAAYVSAFEPLYRIGLPVVADRPAEAALEPRTATAIYLAYLAALPDSHVVRKWGREVAEDVRLTAAAIGAEDYRNGNESRLMALDTAWKARNINPGTSADLTVATIFLRLTGEHK